LKLKPFIECTLTVVGLEEGTGKNSGMTGAFICEGVSDCGKPIRVNVGSGLSDQLRKDSWINDTEVVGSLVEIRADTITKNQNSDVYYSLRFPRFKTFRTLNGNEKL
jgi:ATP-dependent DNA ligase